MIADKYATTSGKHRRCTSSSHTQHHRPQRQQSHTKAIQNDHPDQVRSPPNDTSLTAQQPPLTCELMDHVATGKHALIPGRHQPPPPAHRHMGPMWPPAYAPQGSSHTQSPHHAVRQGAVTPAPSPMFMYMDHPATGKHRWRTSSPPTPHAAHIVPLCS